MRNLPSFDADWLLKEDISQARERWTRSILQSAEEWLATSSKIAAWMTGLTQVRQEMVRVVWQSMIPRRLRDKMDYIVLGSGSRGEDTLYSDLDHAVFLRECVSLEVILPQLSQLITRLSVFGFPVCQGFVMSTNPRWIGTAEDWHARIEGYFQYPDWENSRYLFILLDGKPLAGESKIWSSVYRQVYDGIRESSFIHWEMAHLGIHRTVAMNVLGRVRTLSRDSGEAVNVKEGLLNPIIRSLRLIAVAQGCQESSTLSRIHWLQNKGILSETVCTELEAALEFGWRLRLTQQIADLKNHRPVVDFINLRYLNSTATEELVTHLKTAKQLERWTHRRFPKPR